MSTSNRQKILILGHNDATQFIDIYNQYTRLFDPQKFEVTVAFLTGQASEEVKKRILADHIQFLNFSKKNIRGLKIKPLFKLFSFCKKNNFRIVIAHRYKPAYLMLWIAQFVKITALIFVMHELHTMSSLPRRLLIYALERHNMLFAGVSNAVRDDMRKDLKRLPKEKVITLYNMIDFSLTEPQLFSRTEARKTLKLSEDDFLFVNMARLAPNKDQRTLIKAFSKIKPDCPSAKLIIFGEGILENDLKNQVKSYGLQNEVIFTGFVSQSFRYLRAFDCFVLSSVQEAFGRVLLEAMIAKLPIIASRVHGIPEVLPKESMLITPQDTDGFASAMKQIYLLSRKQRSQLGVIGYQHAFTNFSIPCFQTTFWQLSLVQSLKV